MSKHFTLPYDGGLIEKVLPKGILHSYEKITTEIYSESRDASKAIADIIVDAINSAPKERLFKLGLTTGATPVSLYHELAKFFHRNPSRFFPQEKRLPYRTERRSNMLNTIPCLGHMIQAVVLL